MPVSHLGLTVSRIPTSTSFYLAALQPLGYRYIGSRGDSIGLGVEEADFFLTQASGYSQAPTHIAFTAKDRSTVRDCYSAALRAGAKPSGNPGYRQDDCTCFNAAVEDPDGNTVEFIWREPERPRPTRSSTYEYQPTSQTEVMASPPRGIQRSRTEPIDGMSSKLFGAVIGAAAGAAVGLAMFGFDRDEDRRSERPRSRRSASVASGSRYVPEVYRQIEARPYQDDENISYARQKVTRQSQGQSRAIEAIEYGPSRFSTRRAATMPIDDGHSRRSEGPIDRRAIMPPEDDATVYSRRSTRQPIEDYASVYSKRSSVPHSSHSRRSSRRDSVVSGSSKREARSSTSQVSTVRPATYITAAQVQLPPSVTSKATADIPLPPSRAPSHTSTAYISAARVPARSFDAYYLPDDDGLGDTDTIVPDDSISCVDLPRKHKSRKSSRAGSVMTIPVRSRDDYVRTRNAYSNA